MGRIMMDHNSFLPKTYLPTPDQLSVRIDGQPVRVIRYQHFDEPVYFVHVSCEAGPHEVEVSIHRKQHQVQLHTLESGLRMKWGPAKRFPSLLFAVSEVGQVVLTSDAIGYVCIAFDPPVSEPEGEGVLNLGDAGVHPDPLTVQTTIFQEALNTVSSSEQLTTLVVPAGVYRLGHIDLPSKCRLYLSSGAVLLASDRKADFLDPETQDVLPFFKARGRENLSIEGPGHIDGNRRMLFHDMYHKGLLHLSDCHRVSINGPVFSDASGWNTHLRYCEQVQVQWQKILNNRPKKKCLNTDGCNPDGCRHVRIEYCLMHTGDDAVAVKSTNCGGNPANTHDIRVRNLIAINNSSTCKVGTETMAEEMDQIHFENVYAVRTNRLIVIDAYDVAHIHDVHFQDCHVHEMESDWYLPRLVDIQAPLKAFRPVPAKATVQGVRLERISSFSPAQGRILNRNDEGGPAIQDVDLIDITAEGVPVELEHSFADGEHDQYREPTRTIYEL